MKLNLILKKWLLIEIILALVFTANQNVIKKSYVSSYSTEI